MAYWHSVYCHILKPWDDLVRLQGHIKHAVKRLEDMSCNWHVQSLKLDQDTNYTVGLRGYLRPSMELFTPGNSSLMPVPVAARSKA
jgi:hypothetical protein